MKKILVALLLVVCCVALLGCAESDADRMFSDVEITIVVQRDYELQLSKRGQNKLFDIFETLDWKDYTEDDPLPSCEDAIYFYVNASMRTEKPNGTARERQTIRFLINPKASFVAMTFVPQVSESSNDDGSAFFDDSAITRKATLSEADLAKITAIFDGATKKLCRLFSGAENLRASLNYKAVQLPQQKLAQLAEILEKQEWHRHDGQSHGSQNEDLAVVTADVDLFCVGPQGWTTKRDCWIFRIGFSTGYAIADCVYISSLSSRHFAKLSDADLATVKTIFGYVEPVGEPHRLTIKDPKNYIFDKPSKQSFNAGEEIVLHSEVLTDVDLGMYVDGELACIQTNIDTADGYIWEYRFVMPNCDTTLEFKIVPSSSLVNLKDVFTVAIRFNAQNVESVRFEHGYVGVAPGSLIDLSYTVNTQDVNAALQALDAQLEEVDPFFAQVSGGWYDKITFFNTSGDSFDLTVTNGYVQKNGKYYRFVGSYSEPQYGRKCHSFLTYSDKYTVVKDGVALGEFDGLSQFEFSEYVDQDVLPETGITLQTEFGTISILSDTRFVYEGKDYVLTKGSFNFAFQLVPEN